MIHAIIKAHLLSGRRCTSCSTRMQQLFHAFIILINNFFIIESASALTVLLCRRILLYNEYIPLLYISLYTNFMPYAMRTVAPLTDRWKCETKRQRDMYVCVRQLAACQRDVYGRY